MTPKSGTKRLSADHEAFIFVLPLLLAIVLIMVGAFFVSDGSIGRGLIIVGIGALIGGFGSTATIGYFGLKVIGPAGIALIALGLIAYQILGR